MFIVPKCEVNKRQSKTCCLTLRNNAIMQSCKLVPEAEMTSVSKWSISCPRNSSLPVFSLNLGYSHDKCFSQYDRSNDLQFASHPKLQYSIFVIFQPA